MFYPYTARAQPGLPNWPWRGVSVEYEKSDFHDIDTLKSSNINCVRIYLKVAKRASREKISFYSAFQKELDWAEQIIDACKKNQMTSVLAFNNLQFNTEIDFSDKSNRFWTECKMFDSVYKYVEIFATRFKNKGDELSAYEVVGEPVMNDNKTGKVPVHLAEFFNGVLKAIRKHDSKRYFLLTPGPWAKPLNYKNFKSFGIHDSKIIYNAHMYMPDDYTHQDVHGRDKDAIYPGYYKGNYWDKNQIRIAFGVLKQFQKKNNIAYIFIGEFSTARWSQNKDQYLKDVLDVMEENEFGWCYWTYKSHYNGWDPYYEVSNPQENPASWKIEYKGDQTSTWQMLKSYFQKNKFTMK